jgi:Flp pilus assembly protein TadG
MPEFSLATVETAILVAILVLIAFSIVAFSIVSHQLTVMSSQIKEIATSSINASVALKDIHNSTNSLLDKLIAATSAERFAAGRQAGRDESR